MTIRKKLTAIVLSITVFYSILLGCLFFVGLKSFYFRSEDYIRNITKRFEERLERTFFEQGRFLRESSERQDSSNEGKWQDFYSIDTQDQSTLKNLPLFVLQVLSDNIQENSYQIVANQSAPQFFYIIYALNARQSVVGKFGYHLLFDFFNSILYEEKNLNGLAWEAGLFVNNQLVWSPSLSLQNGPYKAVANYYFSKTAHIPRSNLQLMVFVPRFSLYRKMTSVIVVGIGSLVLSIALIFICTKSVAITITSPLCRLVAATREIPSGDYAKVNMGLDRDDELGELGREFDKMVCELKQLHDTIAKQSADAAIGKIATQVAHDLRSPLTSLKTALKYFQTETVNNSAQSDYMNLLELSMSRLNGIADGLLRKHAGEEEKKLVFSLHSVLDELVGEFSGQELSQDVKFVKEYQSRAIELCGNRSKLQRVFGNVVKNALEAMGGKGTLTIMTGLEGERAAVSISDTGPGMSDGKLQKVLQGGYTEGKKDGHGIGTTVVREVMNEFGGELRGVSTLGEGTTFTFLFPLPQSREIVGVEREKSSMKVFTLEVAEDPTVVVDDEPSMREQWRLLLKEEGCETLLCESYENVVAKKLNSAISRTAIVDYHFENSEKDGAEVIRYLKVQGFTHVTLCTAEYWKPVVQKLAEELGANLCPKPLPWIEVRKSSSRKRASQGTQEIPASAGMTEANAKPSVLVIDDDPGIRLTWKMTKKQIGIGALELYGSMEECEAAKPKYQEIDYAFIDRRIEQSSWSLASTIVHLKKNGVKKVIVASGDAAHVLAKDEGCELADGIAREKIPETLADFG